MSVDETEYEVDDLYYMADKTSELTVPVRGMEMWLG